jgi:hypothetical protein
MTALKLIGREKFEVALGGTAKEQVVYMHKLQL